MFSEDDLKDTPSIVIGSIACGVAPIPFLLVYSAIFLMHGTVFPVDPPDITNSRAGEALSGVVAIIYLIAIVVGIGWFLSQRRRWFFLIGQLISLLVATSFLLDTSSGDPEVPLLLVLTTAGAIILGLLPTSWHWVRDWRYDEVEEATSHRRADRKSRRKAANSADTDAAAPEELTDLSLLQPVVGSPVDPNQHG